jgi:hypothetical protein
MEITVQLLPKPDAKVGFTVTLLAGEGDMVIISGDLPETEASLAALRQEALRRSRKILQACLASSDL